MQGAGCSPPSGIARFLLYLTGARSTPSPNNFRLITLRAHEHKERDVPVTPQMAAGAPMPKPTPPGPAGAPMAQPSPNDGSRQMGMVQVNGAWQQLIQALPTLGADTDEFKAADKAAKLLAKAFNFSETDSLVPAQIAELARTQRASPISQMMSQPQGGSMPQ